MSDGCRVRVTGPLALYVDGSPPGFGVQGYKVQPRDRNLRTLAHVSRWMASRGLSVGELTPGRLEEFLEARRREGYHHALSVRAVMPLMGYLRALGVAPPPGVLVTGKADWAGGGVSSLPPQRAGVDARRGGQVHAGRAGNSSRSASILACLS